MVACSTFNTECVFSGVLFAVQLSTEPLLHGSPGRFLPGYTKARALQNTTVQAGALGTRLFIMLRNRGKSSSYALVKFSLV